MQWDDFRRAGRHPPLLLLPGLEHRTRCNYPFLLVHQSISLAFLNGVALRVPCLRVGRAILYFHPIKSIRRILAPSKLHMPRSQACKLDVHTAQFAPQHREISMEELFCTCSTIMLISIRPIVSYSSLTLVSSLCRPSSRRPVDSANMCSFDYVLPLRLSPATLQPRGYIVLTDGDEL